MKRYILNEQQTQQLNDLVYHSIELGIQEDISYVTDEELAEHEANDTLDE